MTETHQTAKTQYVSSGDVRYAYRLFGNNSKTKIPLMFQIHFRGTMDYWDPLLINAIAAERPVLLFDNAGVGKSSGKVPTTIKGMALHAIELLKLLNISQVDVLGFSMGGLQTPLVYLEGPKGLVRKLIIAGSSASAGEGIVNNSVERTEEVARLSGAPKLGYEDGFDKLFFALTPSSQAAGKAWYQRIQERNINTSGEERSEMVSWGFADKGEGMKNMVAAFANFRDLSARDDGSFDRLGQIENPVLVANGIDDLMLPTINSYVIAQNIPNARLKIFPDSGHGFLYQFAEEFAADVNAFLNANN